jgi:hypothetical protein
LFARFQSTIPLRRQVQVTCSEFRQRDHGMVWTLVGYPYRNLDAVIWILSDDVLVPIIKQFVLNIEGWPPVDTSEKIPLPTNDERFERFRKAIGEPENIRVEFLKDIDDEALCPRLTEMRTITEGKPYALTSEWLTIARGGDEFGEKQAIPRAKILDIVFLGPRTVLAEDMV